MRTHTGSEGVGQSGRVRHVDDGRAWRRVLAAESLRKQVRDAEGKVRAESDVSLDAPRCTRSVQCRYYEPL